MGRRRRVRGRGLWALGVVLLLAVACGAAGEPQAGQTGTDAASPRQTDGAAGGPSGTLRVYSTVTQETVDAVVAAYQGQHPDVEFEVFRAPTGELNARVAAERREGEIRADVLWLTDPLSMRQYEAEALLRAWTPAEVDVVPPEYRTEVSWGTRLLNMVIVHGTEVPAPSSWEDLADPAYADGVAIPDPGFAGSAFGALGYFAEAGDGLDFYRRLADNGAVQVQAPGDVVTGVAEGRFLAGMTLDQAARQAAEAGSPIEVVAPEPGVIAIYSPIAVLDGSANTPTAESFVDFVLTSEAQEAIAATGWQPIRSDVQWPHDEAAVSPDWSAIYERQTELLEEYRAIFGG
ncbi:ABC transporter substrate-binding protein [soil metagenome]